MSIHNVLEFGKKALQSSELVFNPYIGKSVDSDLSQILYEYFSTPTGKAALANFIRQYQSVLPYLRSPERVQELVTMDPNHSVSRALTWVRDVQKWAKGESGGIDPRRSIRKTRENLNTLWRLATVSYITDMGELDINNPEHLRKISDRAAQLLTVAGTKQAPIEALTRVYSNFQDVVRLPPADPKTVESFKEWWDDPSRLLEKLGLLLGVPLAAIGATLLVTDGPKNVLGWILGLLGGGGIAYSLYDYFRSSQYAGWKKEIYGETKEQNPLMDVLKDIAKLPTQKDQQTTNVPETQLPKEQPKVENKTLDLKMDTPFNIKFPPASKTESKPDVPMLASIDTFTDKVSAWSLFREARHFSELKKNNWIRPLGYY